MHPEKEIGNEAVNVRRRRIFPEVEGAVLCVKADKGRKTSRDV